MIKYLPRHTFGYVQSKLFPKYFMLGVALSGISLATFLIDNNPVSGWGFEQKMQVYASLTPPNCVKKGTTFTCCFLPMVVKFHVLVTFQASAYSRFPYNMLCVRVIYSRHLISCQ